MGSGRRSGVLRPPWASTRRKGGSDRAPGRAEGALPAVKAPTFEVYAVRYATREARQSERFYGHDPHDGPMPMDYFVWAAVSPHHTVVVDAGFSGEVAARRGREHLLRPAEGLGALGIECARVPHVVLTHLHYDHVGNLEDFPEATFVVQEREMAFWTGRYAGRERFRALIEPDDVL